MSASDVGRRDDHRLRQVRIYQLAGWMIQGAILVISPLLSLQRDQIDNIEQEQPGEAAAIDASVTERRREERLEELADEEPG